MVSVENRQGKQAVGGYYTNYQKREDWLAVPGAIEGKPGLLVLDRADPTGPPAYFILLQHLGGQIQFIRDFRYARYAMTDAQWSRI